MTAQLSRSRAVAQRMRGHALWHPRPGSPGALVHHFTAMQAQEYSYALWAVAQRLIDTPDAATLASAADRGEILRTHVLRPTWHFVAPADADWLMRLSGPRVQRINAQYLSRSNVDAALLDRAFRVIHAELSGQRHRTRRQLADALGQHGLAFGGLATSFVMMEAELNRLVISGASIGRQRSYALFDERVPPPAEAFDRERALAELLGRFIATRGPVTLKDFAVWSGLTLGDAQTGLAAVLDREPGRFERVAVEGFDCWWQPPAEEGGAAAGRPRPPRVDLVQGYDEYVMSYTPSKALMQLPEYERAGGTLLHTVLVDGVMAAQWKHVLRARAATIVVDPLRAMTAAERGAVAAAARGYGRHLGSPVDLDWL